MPEDGFALPRGQAQVFLDDQLIAEKAKTGSAPVKGRAPRERGGEVVDMMELLKALGKRFAVRIERNAAEAMGLVTVEP